LVTGGAGYVGTVLVPRLLDAGHRVTVFDSLRHGGIPLLPFFAHDAFRFVRGDVRDPAATKEVVRSADLVVHLAAIVGYPACMRHPELARQTNVDGTQNVTDALSSQQRLVFASTGSCYGKVSMMCTEESPLNPISLYAITKSEGESIALEHGESVALRFATAFGSSPRLRMDLLINDFVYRAAIEKQLIVYEPQFRRSFIHVRDIARGLLLSIDQFDDVRGRAYNVGDESLNLTKGEIARRIRDHIPFYLHFADIGHDPDARDYEVSYERIRALGFRAELTLDDGIRELLRVVRVIDLDSPHSSR
jgi:nucleoside-diphosphate-sugar epimerase